MPIRYIKETIFIYICNKYDIIFRQKAKGNSYVKFITYFSLIISTAMSVHKNEIPVRICHLTEIYLPARGGAQVHGYELAEAIFRKGSEVFVITRKIYSNSRTLEKIGNVTVRRISPAGPLRGKGWKAFFPILVLLIKIFFLLIKFKKQYDIILVSSVKVLSLPAILVCKLLNKRCVIRSGSPDELGEDLISNESLKKMKISRSSILLNLIISARNFLFRRTDCYVAISSEIKQQLFDIGIISNKIYTIHHGINTEKFSPVSLEEKMTMRKKYSLPEDKIIFAWGSISLIFKNTSSPLNFGMVRSSKTKSISFRLSLYIDIDSIPSFANITL